MTERDFNTELADAERVLAACRKTTATLREGLAKAIVERDNLLKQREPLAFSAIAEKDAKARTGLDTITKTAARAEYDVRDHETALMKSEQQVEAAKAVVDGLKADMDISTALALRTDLIAASEEFDAAMKVVAEVLQRRSDLMRKITTSGADLSAVPINRIYSKSRVAHAMGAAGIGRFANIEGAHSINHPTLTEMDRTVLSGLRRRDPNTALNPQLEAAE